LKRGVVKREKENVGEKTIYTERERERERERDAAKTHL